jgi:hypothetical protein
METLPSLSDDTSLSYGQGRRRLSQPVAQTHPESPASYITSVRKQFRAYKVAKLRQNRTASQLESFQRVFVHLFPDLVFPIIVDGTRTVDTLARQIEAEYAFIFLTGDGKDARCQALKTLRKLEPLMVGLIYCGNTPLRFEDTIQTVIPHDGTVKVMNVFESKNSNYIHH